MQWAKRYVYIAEFVALAHGMYLSTAGIQLFSLAILGGQAVSSLALVDRWGVMFRPLL